jgi:hypothetical protein
MFESQSNRILEGMAMSARMGTRLGAYLKGLVSNWRNRTGVVATRTLPSRVCVVCIE